MMLFLLTAHALSNLKPVVLLPGTFASLLEITGKGLDLHWYCPKTANHQVFWIDELYFIPPILNCVIEWMRLYYDETTDTITSLKGADIDVVDFGGVGGIAYLDRIKENVSFIPYYSYMIDYFLDQGYIERKNLFGAPFDWRFGIAGLNQQKFWDKLKNLIETAYELNEKQKVTLVGHSFGGFATQYFISTAAEKRWLDKYVEKGIAICPSFGGAGEALEYAWVRGFVKFITIKTETLADTLETMGAVHIHFPNYELFGNTTVFIDPDGKEYQARDVVKLLTEHKRINGPNIKILEKNIPFFEKAPDCPKIPFEIIFNSAQPTRNGIKLRTWDSDTVDEIIGRGDGTVMAEGIEKYCDMYKKSGLVKCHDINNTWNSGGHFNMIQDTETIELVYNKVYL